MSENREVKIMSAGFVIVDFSGREPTALCLLNDFRQWDFPKGKLERGESALDAAIRETEEESGLSLNDIQPVNEISETVFYSVPGGSKSATYFFAERISKKSPYLPVNPMLGKPEHIMLRWFPISSLDEIMPKRLEPVIETLHTWINSSNSQNDTGETERV
jgi:8-oxo-dGTP pyrophosphatase MutT (NUDIX family)